jgi:DNA-binding MarR family transcriptional regulator
MLVQLTPKGNACSEQLIKQRRAADEKLRKKLTPKQRHTLVRLLKVVAELEF